KGGGGGGSAWPSLPSLSTTKTFHAASSLQQRLQERRRRSSEGSEGRKDERRREQQQQQHGGEGRKSGGATDSPEKPDLLPAAGSSGSGSGDVGDSESCSAAEGFPVSDAPEELEDGDLALTSSGPRQAERRTASVGGEREGDASRAYLAATATGGGAARAPDPPVVNKHKHMRRRTDSGAFFRAAVSGVSGSKISAKRRSSERSTSGKFGDTPDGSIDVIGGVSEKAGASSTATTAAVVATDDAPAAVGTVSGDASGAGVDDG
ncbi:unnamed protein product, partial [Scytosiphon promiscuus]